MSELIKNQNFGVEVEFTGISRNAAAKAVAEVLHSNRITGPNHTCYCRRQIIDGTGRIWTIMRDSSITPEHVVGHEPMDEYKVEFVTPILKYEDIETLQSIIRKLKECGAKANKSCGIHIHIDGVNHTPVSLKNMINFMYSRQDLIYEALQIGSRKDNWCKPISAELRKKMIHEKTLTKDLAEQIWYSPANDNYRSGIDHQHYNQTRYHALNLHSFFSKGTVEFRLFNSTLHAGKIKAYIQFCLALSAWSIETNGIVSFHSMNGYTAEKKVTIMYHILTNRLGLYGDEFKTCRLHWMKTLRTNASIEQAA